MSERENGTRIAPETTVGPVHLTVADLDRSIDYYRDRIGLRVIRRGFGAGGEDGECEQREPGGREKGPCEDATRHDGVPRGEGTVSGEYNTSGGLL